jgi:hypothetical protein
MILAVSTYRERLREMIAAPKQVLAQSPLFLWPLIGLETMFHWLYRLPDIGIALLFGIAGACLLAGDRPNIGSRLNIQHLA